MTTESRELLDSQLYEALQEVQTGEGDPFEVAVLAGLLSRLVTADPVPSKIDSLLVARSLRDQQGLMNRFPPEEEVASLLYRLFSLTDETESDERADLLQELDELCAASCFLSEPDHYAGAIEEATSMVRAYPELFRPLAPSASRILADSRFAPNDPAPRLWQAVEASQYEELRILPPACESARRGLGIRPVVSLRSTGAPPMSLSAASGLPVPAPLAVIGQGEQYEVGIGHSLDGEPELLLNLQATATLLHNEQPVELLPLATGLFHAPALVGEYRLQIGGETFVFEVVD